MSESRNVFFKRARGIIFFKKAEESGGPLVFVFKKLNQSRVSRIIFSTRRNNLWVFNFYFEIERISEAPSVTFS